MSKRDALALAQQSGKDLVLVGPNAKPPVAKIVNFSNFKYQQQKKEGAGKKKAKSVELKEVRLTPFIAENDLNTRVNKAREFLEDGDRVKIVIKFIGRQITRKEFGFEVLNKVTEMLKDIAVLDQEAKMMGKLLVATLKPLPKSKK